MTLTLLFFSQQEEAMGELASKLKESNLQLSSTQEQLSSAEQTLNKLRNEFATEHEKLVQSEAEVKVSFKTFKY